MEEGQRKPLHETLGVRTYLPDPENADIFEEVLPEGLHGSFIRFLRQGKGIVLAVFFYLFASFCLMFIYFALRVIPDVLIQDFWREHRNLAPLLRWAMMLTGIAGGLLVARAAWHIAYMERYRYCMMAGVVSVILLALLVMEVVRFWFSGGEFRMMHLLPVTAFLLQDLGLGLVMSERERWDVRYTLPGQ